MTCWPSPSPSSAARIAAWSNPSLAARSALLMFTSGSMIGISPCASTCFATSNCCATIASIPAGLAALITERSLVPKTPSPLARSSSASSPGIGFIIWTPSFSSSSPLSILRNGTIPRSISACAVGLLSTSPSMVRSNRIAPMTLPLAKLGEVMIRTRIWWIRPYICSSPDQLSSATPYPASALGVDPPDWSSAAMKPSPCLILAVISDWFIAIRPNKL